MSRRLIAAFNEIFQSSHFDDLIETAVAQNEWFTRGTILRAVGAIREQMLQQDKVDEWLANYALPCDHRTVGIVMAGNIPLVGFFDLLCVLIVGHSAVVKPSSKDAVLMSHIVEQLAQKGFDVRCVERIEAVDMLIATGGAAAANYYQTNFTEIPTLIRSDRHSVAVLTGCETDEQLRLLTDDMFAYWGLGCRNVNRLILPVGYDMDRLPAYESGFKPLHDSYRYHRALYAMQEREMIDKQGYILTPITDQNPPLAVVYYEYYTDLDRVVLGDNVQCVVSASISSNVQHVSFGESQSPRLVDYADSKNVINFLINS